MDFTNKNVVITGGSTSIAFATINVRAYSATKSAVKRMGQPKEIANTLLFLASDNACFITGSEFLVDGGMT